ncbi:MAG: O-acetyl-ADP-ribose deacetylase, partial [uncultured Actinomycetospora sp.]
GHPGDHAAPRRHHQRRGRRRRQRRQLGSPRGRRGRRGDPPRRRPGDPRGLPRAAAHDAARRSAHRAGGRDDGGEPPGAVGDPHRRPGVREVPGPLAPAGVGLPRVVAGGRRGRCAHRGLPRGVSGRVRVAARRCGADRRHHGEGDRECRARGTVHPLQRSSVRGLRPCGAIEWV